MSYSIYSTWYFPVCYHQVTHLTIINLTRLSFSSSTSPVRYINKVRIPRTRLYPSNWQQTAHAMLLSRLGYRDSLDLKYINKDIEDKRIIQIIKTIDLFMDVRDREPKYFRVGLMDCMSDNLSTPPALMDWIFIDISSQFQSHLIPVWSSYWSANTGFTTFH